MKDIDGYVTKDNLYRVISRIKYKPDIVVDNTTCNIIIEAIYAMPKADVQPVKCGHWTDHHCKHIYQLDANFIQAKCSCCGRYSDKIDSYCRYLDLEYCSHCGARMGGDTE